MIKSTIEKIRKDYSDRMIFFFCLGKPLTGVKIKSARFSFETREVYITCIFPGRVRMITVDADFDKFMGPSYHLSGDIETELKRPEVKFYD